MVCYQPLYSKNSCDRLLTTPPGKSHGECPPDKNTDKERDSRRLTKPWLFSPTVWRNSTKNQKLSRSSTIQPCFLKNLKWLHRTSTPSSASTPEATERVSTRCLSGPDSATEWIQNTSRCCCVSSSLCLLVLYFLFSILSFSFPLHCILLAASCILYYLILLSVHP